MHVIFISPQIVWGGDASRPTTWDDCSSLVQDAGRQGHTVTCLAHHVDNRLLLEPNIEWVRLPDSKAPIRFVGLLRLVWASTQWIRRFGSEADITVAHGAVTWAPVDVCITPSIYSCSHEAEHFSVTSFIVRCILSRARLVLTLSDQAGARLISGGLSADRIATAPVQESASWDHLKDLIEARKTTAHIPTAR